MKEQFELALLELVQFTAEDVITASGNSNRGMWICFNSKV